MDAVLPAIATSAAVVALAEIGDKTMLLAIVLAARYRQPGAVLLGILLATLANHALAAWVGVALAGWLSGPWLRAVVAIGFLAMAAWTLIPDKLDDTPAAAGSGSALIGTAIAFFFVEIGDKTQVATLALAARFQAVLPVTIGTTLGMMLANGPAVLLGEAIVARISLKRVRQGAALIFAVLGIATLLAL